MYKLFRYSVHSVSGIAPEHSYLKTLKPVRMTPIGLRNNTVDGRLHL